MTPAKNARVCSISLSALRPTNATKCPDFCSSEEKSTTDYTTTKVIAITKTPITNLPKPRQHPKEQNCRVHQYSYKLMDKMEVAEIEERLITQ